MPVTTSLEYDIARVIKLGLHFWETGSTSSVRCKWSYLEIAKRFDFFAAQELMNSDADLQVSDCWTRLEHLAELFSWFCEKLDEADLPIAASDVRAVVHSIEEVLRDKHLQE